MKYRLSQTSQIAVFAMLAIFASLLTSCASATPLPPTVTPTPLPPTVTPTPLPPTITPTPLPPTVTPIPVALLPSDWDNYNTDDGLADNTVTSIALAPDGSLWFGTNGGGVTRFDGENWMTYTAENGLPKTHYNHRDNYVYDIAVASDGALWFGTWGGVARFDGVQWKAYTKNDGLADSSVNAIAEMPNGVMWFGTDEGLSRFDGENWTTYTVEDGLPPVPPQSHFLENKVRSLAVAPDEALWIGTAGGVARFDGENWTTYTKHEGLAGNVVESISIAPDKALWFGSRDGGATRFDGEQWIVFSEFSGHVEEDKVFSIDFAPDGAAWLATDWGVYRIDPETLTSNPYTTWDGLPSESVSDILITSEGEIWLAGRYNAGVMHSTLIETQLLTEASTNEFTSQIQLIDSYLALWPDIPQAKLRELNHLKKALLTSDVNAIRSNAPRLEELWTKWARELALKGVSGLEYMPVKEGFFLLAEIWDADNINILDDFPSLKEYYEENK